MNAPNLVCPNCGSENIFEHDTYCDDQHDPEDECFPFYCGDCGLGFEGEGNE